MKLRDLTGQRFGRLTVIKRGEQKNYGNAVWECLCDCGKTTHIAGNHLTLGHVKSCGCLGRERSAARKRTHGGSGSRLHAVWASMIGRCYTTTNTSYPRYGAKGVRVCEEWRRDFAVFRKWALDNGYDENAPRGQYTIDRIDPCGMYEPSNCRWATYTEQNRNKRPKENKNA